VDLKAIQAAAEAAALAAGGVLRPLFDQPHDEKIKANIYDVVTEGDLAAEAAIIPVLRAAFPQFGIVSEEGGGEASESEYAWYIDPIDGTTNFANNIPLFSVSIALADRALRPVVGVVYMPMLGELFSAAQGLGAALNGKPIRVSAVSDMQRAVMSSGFSTQRHTLPENLNNVRHWREMLWRVRDLRRFGSAALDLAYVASGRLDGFWELHIHSWDVLAGICLIQEAGGTVTDYVGTAAGALSGAQVVASNGLLHADMLQVLQG
jgi:myo-inositol-1(or 4)-monophosphatase